MNRVRTTLLAATVALVALPAIAHAEPARKVTLNASTTTTKWEGTGSGAVALQDIADALGCTPGVHDCDDTLIHVEVGGTLTVKTSSTDPSAVDSDLQLFASDETGKVGKELKESAAADPTPAEQVSAELDPGYYIARIDYTIAAQSVVQAEATLQPGVVVNADPLPTGANAAPVTTANKPKGKKVTTLSGTAKDDGTVASVAVGLLQLGKKGKCKQLTASGKFADVKSKCTEPSVFLKAKGGAKWSYKLKKALPKGKYVLFARATDDKGLSEPGFGPANKKAFTVK